MTTRGIPEMGFHSRRSSSVDGQYMLGPPPGLDAPLVAVPPHQSEVRSHIKNFVSGASRELDEALAARDHIAVAGVAQQLVVALSYFAGSMGRDQRLGSGSSSMQPQLGDTYANSRTDEPLPRQMMPQSCMSGEAYGSNNFSRRTMFPPCEGGDVYAASGDVYAASWMNQASQPKPQQVALCGRTYRSESKQSEFSESTRFTMSRAGSKNSVVSVASEGDVPQSIVEELGVHIPSIGSVGHYQGCCRPCDFVGRGGSCRAGVDCRFCHICGPNENRRLKRLKQRLLRSMSSACGEDLDAPKFNSKSSTSSNDIVMEL